MANSVLEFKVATEEDMKDLKFIAFKDGDTNKDNFQVPSSLVGGMKLRPVYMASSAEGAGSEYSLSLQGFKESEINERTYIVICGTLSDHENEFQTPQTVILNPRFTVEWNPSYDEWVTKLVGTSAHPVKHINYDTFSYTNSSVRFDDSYSYGNDAFLTLRTMDYGTILSVWEVV